MSNSDRKATTATPLIKRWQLDTLQRLRNEFRVLLLVGAKQTGKTILTQELVTPNVDFVTLNDQAIQKSAIIDPVGFVQHDQDMLIIDEIQRVPKLIMGVKLAVDTNTRPGQYLLTGSANLHIFPYVEESLADRTVMRRLRSLTQGEVTGTTPDFISRCFDQDFKQNYEAYGRDEIIKIGLRGGFAEVIGKSDQARSRWYHNYASTFLARELQGLTDIRRHQMMQDLLVICAAWSAKYPDIQKISKKLHAKPDTVRDYLCYLEMLFMIDQLPPWSKSDCSKIGRRKKLFMADSGLMASLLGLKLNRARTHPDAVGKLVETLVYHELAAQVDLQPEVYSMSHYRDHDNREIDFLIEENGGRILGIEVKAGGNFSQDDFKHLRWFQNNLAEDRPFTGVVLHTGSAAGSMGGGMWAVPIGAMWEPHTG